MSKNIDYAIDVCWIAAKRLLAERYTYHASALSFTTLLALVPLLSVIVSLISVFPIFTTFVDLTRNYIITNFIPTSSSTIEYYLEGFIQQATSLPTFGIVFLIITAAMLIITIEHTLNDIWQNPKKRKIYATWIVYWLVLLLAPLFIGLSIFLSSYIFSLSWFLNPVHELGIEAYFISFMTLIFNIVMLSVLYIVVPTSKVKWRDGLFGGFIAAVLFEISKILFAFYIQQFSNYELIYGALATIPIFLMWLYIAWLILLYGALITNTLYQKRLHSHSK